MNFSTEECKPEAGVPAVMLGWTTAGSREEAERLGRGLVEAGLVACAQVDGPVTSVYRWKGALETATEYRLMLKFTQGRETAVEAWLHAHHSYELPEWVCVPAMHASKNYLNWVMQTSS